MTSRIHRRRQFSESISSSRHDRRNRSHQRRVSYESEIDGSSSNKSRKRKITKTELLEYATNKALRVAEKLRSNTVSVYSNDSNPFGDSNLRENFVWRKKIERDLSQGVPLHDFSIKAEKKRQKERIAEIERAKKKREEKAIEKAQREEEIALLTRERARAEFQHWEKKEKEFLFEQSIIRSKIRLRLGHYKPIDILNEHLYPSNDFDIELNEPYMVFKGLTVREMEELQKVDENNQEEELSPRIVEQEVHEEEEETGGLYSPQLLHADEENEDAIKPKYFNRVHTCYEWNGYNRTHYDHENPPPKLVQGYKFDIFYPDLLDKSRAPDLFIDRDGESDGNCIIRFSAGPPYQDIAFRIVNKEWECSKNKGFKCKFERGILQVHFNFKRYRYRR